MLPSFCPLRDLVEMFSVTVSCLRAGFSFSGSSRFCVGEFIGITSYSSISGSMQVKILRRK